MLALLLACGTAGSDSQEPPPDPPVMEVTPSSVDATIFLGDSYFAALHITNHGGLPLEVEVAWVTDDGGTEPLATFAVESLERYQYVVVITPEELGLFTGTVQISSNDPVNPVVDVPISLEVIERQ